MRPLILMLMCMCWAPVRGEPLLNAELSWSESAPVSAGAGLRVGQYEQALQMPLWWRALPAGVASSHVELTQTLFTLRGNRLGERRLYRLALPFAYYEKAYGRWHSRYHLTPALYSDERIFDLRAAQLEAGFDTSMGINSQLNLELGARTDRRFGEHRLYYLWGLDWLDKAGWQLHAVLPEPWFGMPLQQQWYFKAGMEPAGSRWRFGTLDHSPLSYKAVQQYLRLQHSFSPQADLSLTLGRRLNRHLDVAGETVRPSPAPYWQLDMSAHW